MQRRTVLALTGIALSTGLAGCSARDDESQSTHDDSVDDTGDEPTAPSLEFQSFAEIDDRFRKNTQTLTGTGSEVTDEFELADGLAVLNYALEGDGNLIVDLVGGPRTDQQLVGELDAGSGTAAAHVEESAYRLDVSTDEGAEWELEIAQPDTKNESIPAPPVSISGEGNDVVGPVRLRGGEISRGSHDGYRNFFVDYKDERELGFTTEPGHNVMGEVEDDETALDIEGTMWAVIFAEGEWELEVEV